MREVKKCTCSWWSPEMPMAKPGSIGACWSCGRVRRDSVKVAAGVQEASKFNVDALPKMGGHHEDR